MAKHEDPTTAPKSGDLMSGRDLFEPVIEPGPKPHPAPPKK
jgi:hypothetical protein